MPIIKSAKKRVRVARKATVRNFKTKRNLKSALKNFQAAVTGGGKKAAEAHSKAQSELHKATKKGVMHKNKAARKQRQLAAAAKKSGLKPTATAKTTKKTTSAAKPAAKKTASKPAAKKTTAKKTTTTKKPTAKKTAKK